MSEITVRDFENKTFDEIFDLLSGGLGNKILYDMLIQNKRKTK